jgi:hypothetical protein
VLAPNLKRRSFAVRYLVLILIGGEVTSKLLIADGR